VDFTEEKKRNDQNEVKKNKRRKELKILILHDLFLIQYSFQLLLQYSELHALSSMPVWSGAGRVIRYSAGVIEQQETKTKSLIFLGHLMCSLTFCG
jgi:hypothetical protein